MSSWNKVDLVLLGWMIFTQLSGGLAAVWTDEKFLQEHNRYRQLVLDGWVPNQPRAIYLPPLRWNPDLKERARQWAERCVYATESNPEQGENMAASRGGISDPVEMWYNEHWVYKMGQMRENETYMVWEYIQIVTARTTDLGCFMHLCPELTAPSGMKWTNAYFTVCRYAPPANRLDPKPYPIAGDEIPTETTTIRTTTTPTTTTTPIIITTHPTTTMSTEDILDPAFC